MDNAFELIFPAIRGVQAGREFYVSMCHLRLLPKLFEFEAADLGPEHRAQRQLNRQRVPEIARYIVENPKDYVFSAITASVDGDLDFQPDTQDADVGRLRIPMESRFVINDGQHRRAAVEAALKERPDLGSESISVVLFHDRGLARCQQMFADLNRYAIRPSPSLSVLYDGRDPKARLSKLIVDQLPEIRDLVDLERSSLSRGSKQLFTLSALTNATSALLDNRGPGDDEPAIVVAFWQEVYKQLAEWQTVRRGEETAGSFRATYIHGHAVALHALGRLGNALLHHHQDSWRDRIVGLASIDWRRDAPMWNGRAVTGGSVQNSRHNVLLTTNAIKAKLGLALGPEEQRVEDAWRRENSNGR